MKVYHVTKKENVSSILQEGLKINSGISGLIVEGGWADQYYYCRPVYVSLSPDRFQGEVVLEVDVSDTDLLPDLPSLLSVSGGAEHYEDDIYGDGLWYDKAPEELEPYDAHDGSVPIDSILKAYGDLSVLRLTNSAAVCKDIPPDKIRVYSKG